MEPTLFHIQLFDGGNGMVTAECMNIDGCVSQGRTVQEALLGIVDAIETCWPVAVGKRCCSRMKMHEC